MNKVYFKYGNGYLNIDNENIYFTVSGNWDETRTLGEMKSKNNLKRQNILFWAIFLVFAAISIWWHSYLVLIILIVFLGVDNLFDKKYNGFKIPHSKLIRIVRNGKNVMLQFYNTANEQMDITLKKVKDIDYQLLNDFISKN